MSGTGTLIPSLDDFISETRQRMYNLEQRMTNPAVVVGNGMNVTFPQVTIGVPGQPGGDVVSAAITPSTGVTATPGAIYDSIYADIAWDGPLDDTAVEYEVQVGEKSDQTYLTAFVRRTLSESIRIEGLRPNLTYGVRVYSVNRLGRTSAPTAWVDFTTASDGTVPAQVMGINAVSGYTSITVNWEENAEPDVADGHGLYEVQRATNAAMTTGVSSEKVAATIVSYTGLPSGSPLYFRVRAIDSSGNEGAWSMVVSATPGEPTIPPESDGAPPASSPTPTVTSGFGFLYLRWTAVANPDPVTYEVHISTTDNFTADAATRVGEVNGTVTSIRTNAAGAALVYGTSYYVRLIAKDVDGAAAQSADAGPFTVSQVGSLDLTAAVNTSITNAQTSANNAQADADAALINAATAQSAAQDAQVTADSKVVTYFQAAAPTGLVAGDVGDLWFDSDDGYKMHRWSGSAWIESSDTRISTALINAATAQTAANAAQVDADQALADAADAQATADGKIRSFFQTTAPTGLVADDVGDLWFDTDDANKMYRWSGSVWTISADTRITDALNNAAAANTAAGNAQTTANSKIVTFYQAAAPTATTVGDLWVDTDDGNRLYRWSGSAWTATLFGAAAISATARDLGAITTYFQAAAPTGTLKIGDLWIDTDDNNKSYRWDGAAWVLAADARIVQALADAAGAQATADGKVRSFFQTTAPTGLVAGDIGDLWFDTDDAHKMYRWDGAAWVLSADTRISQALTDAAAANTAAGNAQTTANSKIVTFYQTAAPTATTVGDLWVDTDDSNKLHRWDGSAWVQVRDAGIGQALTDAANAQQAADAASIAQAINTNPLLANWTGTLPADWSTWNTAPIKETVLDRTPPHAARWNITSSGTQGGMTAAPGTLTQMPLNLEYVTVEIDVYLVSGSFQGSGIILDWTGMTNNRTTMHLFTEITSPGAGKWYRVTKVLRRPTNATGTQTSWSTHFMANWATFGNAVKQIVLDKIIYRRSSDAEVMAYNAATAASVATLQTQVNTVETTASSAQTAANTAQTAANNAQAKADTADAAALNALGVAQGKGKVYYQPAAPAGDPNGLWIDTDEGNKPYRWNTTTSAWEPVQDQAIIAAADAAANAQTAANNAQTAANNAQTAANNAQGTANTALTSANGKNAITHSASAPTTPYTGRVGDTWWRYDASEIVIGQWRWDGAAWVAETIGNLVIANLDASKITSGFIQAARFEAGSITAASGVILDINADIITTGFLRSDRLLANSIGVRELVVSSQENMVVDPQIQMHPTPHLSETMTVQRYTPGPGIAYTTNGYVLQIIPILAQNQLVKINGASERTWQEEFRRLYPANEGEPFYAEMMVRAQAADTRRVQLRFNFRGYNYASLGTQDGAIVTPNATGWTKVSVNTTPPTYGGTPTPGGCPAGTVWIALELWILDSATGTWPSNDIYVAAMQWKRKNEGRLIVDGTLSATHIQVGSLTGESGVFANLSATDITYGSMNGGLITADTAEIEILRSGTITARTFTLSATGFLRGLNAGGGTGWLLNEDGYRLYNSIGEVTVSLNRDGSASFTGTVNAAGGSFTGNITSTATITGGDFVGGTFATDPVATVDRALISDDGLNIQREGTINSLESPGYWFSSDWQTTPMANTTINSGTYYSGWKLDWESANSADYTDWKLVDVGGLIYKTKFTKSVAGTANATFYQDYSATAGGITVSGNQAWTWSAWVKSSSSIDPAWVEVECRSATDVILATFTGVGTDGTTTGTVGWRRCKVSFTTPINTTKIRVTVIFPGSANIRTFYSGVWQLENKDHMTTWAGPGQINSEPLDSTRSDSGHSRPTFDLFRSRSDIVDNIFWGKTIGSYQAGHWRDGMLRIEPPTGGGSATLEFEAARSSATAVPLIKNRAQLYTVKVLGTPGYISQIGLRVGDRATDFYNWGEINIWRGNGIFLYTPLNADAGAVHIGIDNYYGNIRHSGSVGNFHFDSFWGAIYMSWFGGNSGIRVGNGTENWGPVLASAFNVQSTEDSKEDMLPLTDVIDKIKRIRTVKFHRSDQDPRVMLKGKQIVPVEHVSVVAESLLNTIPEAAAYYPEDENVVYKTGKVEKKKGELFGVDINALAAVNTAAIQELVARLEVLEAKLNKVRPDTV